MKKTREELLSEALKTHADAVAGFALAARNVPTGNWSPDQERWTAAQITEHLTLVYEVLLRELSGGSGMRIVTNFWQKALARWLVLRPILNSGIFPKGARAPKETRPMSVRADQQIAVATFEELAGAFQEKVQLVYSQDPNAKLTHAYFGAYTLDSAVLLCAQHVLHHCNHLKF
ncbi:DinB family protein [bacterium]|nr:DinB family protein [bacterium]MCI0602719.1 DinB family protein [bacterium]